MIGLVHVVDKYTEENFNGCPVDLQENCLEHPRGYYVGPFRMRPAS